LENPSHQIDFNNPKILAREKNWRKLKIKETLFIQRLQLGQKLMKLPIRSSSLTPNLTV